MGYLTSVSGELSIQPPLAYSEFRDSEFAEPSARSQVWLEIEEEHKATVEGVLTVRRAINVVTYEDSFKAYDFDEQLQKLVSSFPGHEFVGRFYGEGEENDDIWRVRVSGGKVQRIKPRIVWPDDEEQA